MTASNEDHSRSLFWPVGLCILIQLALPISAMALSAEETACKEAAFPEQIAACTRLLAITKNQRDRSIYLYNRGIAFKRMPHPDCDAAIADFEDGIRTFAAAHVQNNYLKQLSYSGLTSTWLECKGNPDKAIEVASEAIRNIPQVNNYLNRGIAYYDKRQFDLALKDYGEALSRAEKIAPSERNPTKANLFNSVAACGWKSGISTARWPTLRMRYVWRQELLYLANRGKIWRLKGYLDQALADQTKALDLNPDTFIERTERGNTFRYRGQLDDALADYNRVSQLSATRHEGEYAPAATGRGLVYEKLGNLELARSEFLKALSSQNPERDVAKDAIETARAHLAAFDSGEAPPVIPPGQFTLPVRRPSQPRRLPRRSLTSRCRANASSHSGQARPTRCTGDRQFRLYQRPCSYKPEKRFRCHCKVSCATSVSIKSHWSMMRRVRS